MIHRAPRTDSLRFSSSIDPGFSRFGGERAVFLDPSFLFPRESRSPVINDCSSYGGQTRVYIHTYIYIEIETRCDSPGRSKGVVTAERGVPIFRPAEREFRNRDGVCRQSIRQKEAQQRVHARDTMRSSARPPLPF